MDFSPTKASDPFLDRRYRWAASASGGRRHLPEPALNNNCADFDPITHNFEAISPWRKASPNLRHTLSTVPLPGSCEPASPSPSTFRGRRHCPAPSKNEDAVYVEEQHRNAVKSMRHNAIHRDSGNIIAPATTGTASPFPSPPRASPARPATIVDIASPLAAAHRPRSSRPLPDAVLESQRRHISDFGPHE